MWFLLGLLALPILEIALFIQVGALIGLWPTLGLVLLSAVAGAGLIRGQGLQTLGRLRARVEAGDDLAGPLADAGMILIAGLLLLTPGFFTDALGLLLLIPPIRAALLRRIGRGLSARSVVFTRTATAPRRPAGSQTIEAEYEVLDDVPPAQRGASGWTRPRP